MCINLCCEIPSLLQKYLPSFKAPQDWEVIKNVASVSQVRGPKKVAGVACQLVSIQLLQQRWLQGPCPPGHWELFSFPGQMEDGIACEMRELHRKDVKGANFISSRCT